MKYLFYLLFASSVLISLGSCNKCKDVTCENGALCSDGSCVCPFGYSGTKCEVEDLCIVNEVECENDGECVEGNCKCKGFYRGPECATLCENGKYNPTNESCDCYDGWDSEGCSYEMRKKWIGTYDLVTSGCNFTTSESVISEKDYADEDSVDIIVNLVGITNLTTFGDTKGYGVILPGRKLHIPSQKVPANGSSWRVESDTAEIVDGAFELNVERQEVGSMGSTVCTLNYSLQ